MTTDHWFDQLNKALVQRAPRRGVLGGVVGLLGGLATTAGAAAPKRKPKPKPKRKPKPKPKRTPKPKRCAKALCARNFRTQKQRRRCEEKCGRCRIRAKFCVSRPDLAHPDAARHATCCKDGQKCCQDTRKCCLESAKCCPASHVKAGKSPCCAGHCCIDASTGCCPRDQYCCPGVGCVADQQACACATGGECPCPDGRHRCNGICCPRLQNGQLMTCFGGTTCCIPDFVEPFWCPSTTPDPSVVCVPDSSHVCCDGHAGNVGTTDPASWVCCNRGSRGFVIPARIGCRPGDESYAPLATRTYGQG